MEQKLFSFIVLTYNHQNYIRFHLESIKYQILNFGKNLDFELIIGDDCSNDNTIQLTNDWIEENRNLFKKVIVDISDQNNGITNNFIKTLKLFTGDYFKVLAGDDLYSCSNLFDCVRYLDHFDIVQGALLEFEDEKVKVEIEYFKYVKYFQNIKLDQLKRDATYGNYIFRAPSFFLKKELIKDDVIKFISEFKMCEDKPLFHMLLSNENLKIKFHPDPIVLYRISSSSIARNLMHQSKSFLVSDNIKFNDILLAKTSHPFAKYYFKYQHYNLIGSQKKYLFKINPILILYKLRAVILSIKYYKRVERYYKSIDEAIQMNQKYLDTIRHLIKYNKI